MNDFIDVLSKYTLSDIVIICAGVYGAYYFIRKRIKEYKQETQEQKQNYHDEQREIEQHEETVETRLTSLEKKVKEMSDVHKRLDNLEEQDKKHDRWIGNDKSQIEALTKQISELSSTVTSISSSVSSLDGALTDLRLKQMREFILNSVSICTDLSKPVSFEFYTNIQKTYLDYENLLHSKDLQNGFCIEAMKLIEASQIKRAEAGMFTSQYYGNSTNNNGNIISYSNGTPNLNISTTNSGFTI